MVDKLKDFTENIMPRFLSKNSFSILIFCLAPFTTYALPGDRYQVLDFDFSLTCDSKPLLGNPQFPDSNVTNDAIVPDAIFIDGEYGGQVPVSAEDSDRVDTYLAFDYIGAAVSNYTAPTGVDGINHPPPTFDLTNLTANLSSFYAFWNGTEFNQGNPDVPLIDNLDGTFSSDHRSIIVGGTFDGCTGRWKMLLDCLDCPPSQLGTSPELAAYQGSSTTRTVILSAGDVIITSELGKSPAGFGFGWVPSDSNIVDIDGDTTDGSFTFDPSSLSPGIYTFTMSYGDNNTTPKTNGVSNIKINVVTSTTADMNDDNNNGIPNVNDNPSLTSSQLMAVTGDVDTFILQSSSGKLKLGTTAFCAEKAAMVNSNDIANFGSDTCTSATNATDDRIKSTGVGGFFDFEIHNLTAGEQVQIVLPLSRAIPPNATYRKYYSNSGWAIFDATGTDRISSSQSFSNGICPSPSSRAYTGGLTQGNTCVRLSITDGGPNDTDGSANGVIVDPGGVAEIESGIEAELSSGCTLSSTPQKASHHLEWIINLLFLGYLFLIKSKVKRFKK